MITKAEIFGLRIDKEEIRLGVDIADLILRKCSEYGLDIEDGDIIVITSKILSIAMGRLYNLNSVRPSFSARLLSRFFKEDARVIELLLREGEPIGVIPVLKIEKLLHIFDRYSG